MTKAEFLRLHGAVISTTAPLKQKTDFTILCTRLRDIAARNLHRSEAFKRWVKQRTGKDDFHHVFGSFGSLKTTDLAGIALTREEHTTAHATGTTPIEHVVGVFQNMLDYIKYLEAKQ